jgi:catalase
MKDNQKEQLFGNIYDAMQGGIPERIIVRQLVHFYKADPDYGKGAAKKLGINLNKIKPLASLSLNELIKATSEEKYKK